MLCKTRRRLATTIDQSGFMNLQSQDKAACLTGHVPACVSYSLRRLYKRGTWNGPSHSHADNNRLSADTSEILGRGASALATRAVKQLMGISNLPSQPLHA